MTYDLAIADRIYSSWSLRGWLLLEAFGLPARIHFARLYTDEMPRVLAAFAPARTVPALRCPDGSVLGDSLAIAEELASRHPEAGHWPAEPRQRAAARMLAAEMHSSFRALREHCPMNLRDAYTGITPPDAVLADLARIETLWSWARELSGSTTPWLFGAFSAADAFYAPVAGRIAGYGLPVGPEAQAYVDALLALPAFRRWRAMGLAEGVVLSGYDRPNATRPWPGPTPRPARAIAHGPAENAACPYSGKPVTHFLELDGRIWGFCNAFCRDKTLADPEAWPAFTALL